VKNSRAERKTVEKQRKKTPKKQQQQQQQQQQQKIQLYFFMIMPLYGLLSICGKIRGGVVAFLEFCFLLKSPTKTQRTRVLEF
jgi:hypothetical protein